MLTGIKSLIRKERIYWKDISGVAIFCVGYRNKNGYDFLFGLSKTIDRKNKEINEIEKQNIAGIKVLEGNTLIDEVYFDTGRGEELSSAAFNIESNHKLQNVEFTLKAMVSGRSLWE